jgi:hypothetical protein
VGPTPTVHLPLPLFHGMNTSSCGAERRGSSMDGDCSWISDAKQIEAGRCPSLLGKGSGTGRRRYPAAREGEDSRGAPSVAATPA